MLHDIILILIVILSLINSLAIEFQLYLGKYRVSCICTQMVVIRNFSFWQTSCPVFFRIKSRVSHFSSGNANRFIWLHFISSCSFDVKFVTKCRKRAQGHDQLCSYIYNLKLIVISSHSKHVLLALVTV